MKVLHVNGHLAGGGVEQYLSQLFPLLRAHGVGSLLLHGEDGEPGSRPADIPLYYIQGITRAFCHDLQGKLRRVAQIIDQERPDIAYLHQMANPSLLRLLTSRLPTVRFVHDYKLVCPEGKKILNTRGKKETCTFPLAWQCQFRAYRYRCMPRDPQIGVPLLGQCLAMASLHQKESHMVVASRFMEEVLLYNGFSRDKITIIPYFTELPALDAGSREDQPPLILALGRITREKGFEDLLRAFAALPTEALLTILGEGPDLTDLKSFAERLGLNSRVKFTGWLPHDQLDSFYRRCSLVVVPSLWPEPFGIVGIEAMAYGKPVVAYDVGGISEWLENGKTGYLIPRGDIRALTDKIASLADYPQTAEQIGQTARAAIDNRFTAASHCESLAHLFQLVIREHEHHA